MLTVYIIVKHLLKIMQEITLQFGVLSNYAPREMDYGNFLWKNIGPEWVEFAITLVQMPGDSAGSTPLGWPLISALEY